MFVPRPLLSAACLVYGLGTVAQPAIAGGHEVLLGGRRPLGPRITAFEASIGRVGQGVGLRLRAQVEPDEAFPSVRPTRQDLQLTVNERRLKREAYRFDETTGALHLALDRDDLKTLCGPLPEPYRSYPQNRHFEGCRVALHVTSRLGGSATKTLAFPNPEAALIRLLGTEAPPGAHLAPLMPGRSGSPGGSAPTPALHLLEEPRPLPGNGHAHLRLMSAAGARATAIMTANGPPMWLDLGPAAAPPRITPPRTIPDGPALVTAHHNGHDYALYRTASETGRFRVQDLTTGKRLNLPRDVFDVDDLWASDEQVVVLDVPRLTAYTWDGRERWHRELLTTDRRAGTALTSGSLLGDGNGGLYLLAAGDLPAVGLRAPFLYGATFAPDGTPRASAMLLDPASGEFDVVESIRPAVLGGRYLAVVSLSGPVGTRVRTRIFDMATPTGRPIAELSPPMSTAPWWAWGAASVGDRLFVGTGNHGIAVYGAKEAR
ncbi:hypothetical protein D3C72_869660 [compost metagenome]